MIKPWKVPSRKRLGNSAKDIRLHFNKSSYPTTFVIKKILWITFIPAFLSTSRVCLTFVWSLSSTPVRHNSSRSHSRLSTTAATRLPLSVTLNLAADNRCCIIKKKKKWRIIRTFLKLTSENKMLLQSNLFNLFARYA